MDFLRTGTFFGETNRTVAIDGVTLTDTEYTHPFVDWHHHENAYFTFILQGQLLEGSRRRTFRCGNGGLLFHHAEEPHFNEKPDVFTRGFHVEISRDFVREHGCQGNDGSFEVLDPTVKLLLYRIFRETKIDDDVAAVAIQMDLSAALAKIGRDIAQPRRKKPSWTAPVAEFLHDSFADKITLKELATVAGIHPTHLSRDFTKHFGCNIGEFVRRIRVGKALALMPDRSLTLTEIAFRCGFADQSHFDRVFRAMCATTPSSYRQLFSQVR